MLMNKSYYMRPASPGPVEIRIPGVPGVLWKSRVDQVIDMINSRETIFMTVTVNGDVRDINLYFAEGKWHFEEVSYQEEVR